MKTKTVARSALIILFLGIAAFSIWKIYEICREYAVGVEIYEAMEEKYAVSADASADTHEDVDPTPKETAPIRVDFDSLLKECSDITAWIYCADTPINYPVAQSRDNRYYLRRLPDGSYHINGTIFMDFRNHSDLSDQNTVLYGHNMKNDSMFGILPEYQNQAFYDAHPIMYLLTPDRDYKIELFAGYTTPSDSIAYTIPQTQEEQDALVNQAVESSTFLSDVTVHNVDRLITLSTCAADYGNDRYVLVGVLRDLAPAE